MCSHKLFHGFLVQQILERFKRLKSSAFYLPFQKTKKGEKNCCPFKVQTCHLNFSSKTLPRKKILFRSAQSQKQDYKLRFDDEENQWSEREKTKKRVENEREIFNFSTQTFLIDSSAFYFLFFIDVHFLDSFNISLYGCLFLKPLVFFFFFFSWFY